MIKQIKAVINIDKAEGYILEETDDEVITKLVELEKYTITVYDKKNDRMQSEVIIPYEYLESNKDDLDSLVYWLIRGIHGIPLEFRTQKKAQVVSVNTEELAPS